MSLSICSATHCRRGRGAEGRTVALYQGVDGRTVAHAVVGARGGVARWRPRQKLRQWWKRRVLHLLRGPKTHVRGGSLLKSGRPKGLNTDYRPQIKVYGT
eukprot:3310087-Pyramimonas_sp.AAC.1